MLFIGVDGGGTKTLALALDGHTGRFALKETGPGNPSVIGFAQAGSRVKDVVEQAIAGLSGDVTCAFSLCVALAGVGRGQDRARMRELLQGFWPHAQIVVIVDPHAALLAGTAGESGVVLIAGTGSMAYGMNPEGDTARAGGFGYLLGDEGSGFAIGQAGLAAALTATEGRGPDTVLLSVAATYFGESEQEVGTHLPAFLWQVYAQSEPVRTIAGFAREVLAYATIDAVAHSIIQRAVASQVALVRSVRTRLSGLSPTVLLAGGLIGQDNYLRSSLIAELAECDCRVLTRPPVTGACLMAIREAGQETEQSRETWREVADRVTQGIQIR
ncbi:MAG: hypothetical protein OWT28_03160 [Firmicutes bacterium]|nr:hypothetical protein [Bacillota bacterium]